MTTTAYKVLIIGCGNMAGGYDLIQPDDALPLGHAKAFVKHGGFALSACVDPDAAKLAAFQHRWKCPPALPVCKRWQQRVVNSM